MKRNLTVPLVGILVLGLAVVCTGRTLNTADFFFPHVTVTHTTSAPDDGDQPYTALDSIFASGYTGYLSTSDRVKYFQELIQPNLEKDGFRVCTIETVETECEQCIDECAHQIQILHASICKGQKKVCKTSTCTQSKQVCRAPGDISGGISSAGVPIKVWFHLPTDGSTPHWGATEGKMQQMLNEANPLLARAGFKLVMGGVNFFSASKADMTASTGSDMGFTKNQVRLRAQQRRGGAADLNVWMAHTTGATRKSAWGAYSPYLHHTTAGIIDPCNDGIVMDTKYVLKGDPVISGAVLVHELGHWLQLPHPFREDSKSEYVEQLVKSDNIPAAKQRIQSGELCAVDNDSDILRKMLPEVTTGREGFAADVPLSTPHQPLQHLHPVVLALPGWEGFKNAHDGAAMANYKALGCGGVGASKVVISCPNQDRPDDYTNLMDYMPDACRTLFTAQQIGVMHTGYRVRQEISINGKTDKYPKMQASRCLTGA